MDYSIDTVRRVLHLIRRDVLSENATCPNVSNDAHCYLHSREFVCSLEVVRLSEVGGKGITDALKTHLKLQSGSEGGTGLGVRTR